MSYGMIYMIINKINNKVYIGQTIHSLKERYPFGIENTHNEHLRKSIRYYGKENFQIIENIATAETKEELDSIEKDLIAKYKATNKKYGYNYLSGGHNGRHNEESRRKIGEAQKGELNHNYGKYGKDSPKYSRVKMNCFYCGKEIEVLPCDVKRSKRHYCSVECAQKDRVNALPKRKPNKIKAKCENCGKEVERYKSQLKDKKHVYCCMSCKDQHQKTLLKGKNNPNYGNNAISGSNNGRARKVVCVTTGEVFECARDAEKKYNMSRGLVGACCRGEQKTAYSMKWKYLS